MTYASCPKCHNFDPVNAHTCPPAWHVWQPDQGSTREDARTVYAYSRDTAVERWAERDDAESADYCIIRGTEATVLIARADGPEKDVVATYTVSGESVPEYTARLVEPKEEINEEETV